MERPRAHGGDENVVLTGYIRRIDKLIMTRGNALLAPYGLTMPQAVIVWYLDRHHDEPVYQRQLEAELELKSPTVTAMIKTLVKNGVVQRTREEHDGRYFRITLTEKGQGLVEPSVAALRNANAIYSNVLTPSEFAQLEALFVKILEGNSQEE